MASRVTRHAEFFITIDHNCASPEEISQERLLTLYGAEQLRRAERIVAFLVKQLGLVWDDRVTIAHIAERRIKATLAAAADQPWVNELEAFQAYLRRRNLSPRTIRSYISAATGLMQHARAKRVVELTQRNVNGWLRLRRGRANDLSIFTTWVAGNGGSILQIRGYPTASARKRERKILAAAKLLLTRLGFCRTERQMKALLARAIAITYGVRLEDVLALHSDDIMIGANGLSARIRGKPIMLLEPFADLLFRFRQPGQLIFAGRAGFKPLSVDGTRHHVRRVLPKSP